MSIAHHKPRQNKTFLHDIVEILILLVILFGVRTFFFGLYIVPTGSMETTMLVQESFFADKLSYWLREPRHGEIIACNDPYFQYSENPAVKLFQRFAWGPQNWTKRIIGKPGDHIKGSIEDGHPVIYRNGIKIQEPYLNQYPLICEKGISKSYDPSKSWQDQPFYRIDPTHVDLNSDKSPRLIMPGVPHRSPTGWNITQRQWNGTDEFEVILQNDEYWLMGDNRMCSKDSRCFGPYKKNNIHGRIIFRIWSDKEKPGSWLILNILKNPIGYFRDLVRWKRIFQTIS